MKKILINIFKFFFTRSSWIPAAALNDEVGDGNDNLSPSSSSRGQKARVGDPGLRLPFFKDDERGIVKSLLLISLLILPAFLGGCNLAKRLGDVGEPPEMSQIQNPTTLPNYKPVTMPMPTPTVGGQNKCNNSLWETGSRAFFKDQRANKVGDIITVVINIANQRATLDAKPTINRTATQNTSLTAMMGYESKLQKLLPKKLFPEDKWSQFDGGKQMLGMSSNPSLTGEGKYDTSDTLSFNVAAIVTQILPNGTLVITGRREMRVYNEVRELLITGIVRKEDITSSNTISQDKIAEARVSFGGRGDLTDMQSFPWLQQALNKTMPF